MIIKYKHESVIQDKHAYIEYNIHIVYYILNYSILLYIPIHIFEIQQSYISIFS